MAIAAIQDLSDPTFDPVFADEVIFGDIEDPYSILADLRRQSPVVQADFREVMGVPVNPASLYAPHWIVLSFAGVDHVLNHPEIYSNHSMNADLEGFGHTVSVMDPPEHTRYRRILQKAFRPNIVQAWGDGIVAPVIEELVSTFRGTGRAELVEQFARLYPFTVIYRMLGLPAQDIDVFYKLTLAQLLTGFAREMALEASDNLGQYFRGLLETRREDPGTDLVSVLATTQIDGEYLPDDVAISFLRQLINAGGDTTFRTTTALLTGLLTNQDQLDAARADRELIPLAVEEALRWEGPVTVASREAVSDSVIDGVEVPAGAYLDMCYGSANRDEKEFAHPELFDIYRPRHRHFGFAFGIHNCLGQVLARLEMSRAMNAIFDNLPNVRLDPDVARPVMRGAMLRTPRELRVVFD
jgi:cytochrome P450